MLSTYAEILRHSNAWRFSLAGCILRLPMSMMGISIVLLVHATYGNYTVAGAVSAINIASLAVAAPVLARLVDAHGQLKIMAPAFVISALSAAGLFYAALVHAPIWIVFLMAAISGASWGSPGALVRSRWMQVTRTPQQLNSAYALESAVDEFVYILGPIVATVLGSLLHPGIGVVLSAILLLVGGAAFLAQRSSEPPVVRLPHDAPRKTSVLRNPAVLILVITYVGMGALFGANDVSVVAFTQEEGVPALSGVLLALFSVGSLTSALIYGARTWVRPLWWLFARGVAALGLGVTTYLFASNLWTLGLVMLITGVTCAPTMTNVNMMIAKTVPASQLTEGLAWMSTSLNIGLSLGASAAGPAIDRIGSQGGYYVMVAFGWAMVAFMFIGLRPLRRSIDEVLSAEREKQHRALSEGELRGDA